MWPFPFENLRFKIFISFFLKLINYKLIISEKLKINNKQILIILFFKYNIFFSIKWFRILKDLLAHNVLLIGLINNKIQLLNSKNT